MNMKNLHVFNETFTNGYFTLFLTILSLSSITFGIYVIVNKNPIVSVLSLIFLFSNVAVYLIMLGLKFIGISYLLVYVGAVSILFLFILMLINIRISELVSNTGNGAPLAVFITILFYYPVSEIISYNTNDSNFGEKLHNILYATSNSWDGTLADASDITSLGNIMYSNYSIWLLITSLVLLLSMVGAIVITIR
jgi:NADH-ubiquinone oxidoreductase chain 6